MFLAQKILHHAVNKCIRQLKQKGKTGTIMKNSLLACIIVSILLTTSFGVSATIASDPNAINYNGTIWNGTANFYYEEDGTYLSVDVDYAVFPFCPQMATYTADRLMYAYQIFVNEGSTEVSSFSVAVDISIPHGNINHDVDMGVADGKAPFAAGFTGTSAVWSFLIDTIQADEHSSVLYFTSPNPPTMGSAALHDSGLSAMAYLPTPAAIPEPQMLCFGIVLIALSGRFGIFKETK
jgi:hypothetical protein